MLGERRLRDRYVPGEVSTTAFRRGGNGLHNPQPGGIREGFGHFHDVLRRHQCPRPSESSAYSYSTKYTYCCLKRQGLWCVHTHDRPQCGRGTRPHRAARATDTRPASCWSPPGMPAGTPAQRCPGHARWDVPPVTVSCCPRCLLLSRGIHACAGSDIHVMLAKRFRVTYNVPRKLDR
jgi:hypothetical protein